MYFALKNGIFFVPLDTDYPIEVCLFRLRAASCSAIVVETNKMAQFAKELINQLAILVNGCHVNTGRYGQSMPLCNDTPAYCFFTSGSSGNPKGVEIKQAQTANFLKWMKSSNFCGKQDTLLWQGSISFDLFIYFCSWPLISQGKLSIVKQGRNS